MSGTLHGRAALLPAPVRVDHPTHGVGATGNTGARLGAGRMCPGSWVSKRRRVYRCWLRLEDSFGLRTSAAGGQGVFFSGIKLHFVHSVFDIECTK